MINREKWREIQIKSSFEGTFDENLSLPNELFTKLLLLVKEGKLKSTHIGFAYSYIYFETYMYRYAKYQKYVPTVSEIKEILGYSGSNKNVDYIIKKNGLLEQEGILLTQNNFPIAVGFDDIEKFVFSTTEELNFTRQFREQHNLTKNQFCKLPVFAFNQSLEAYKAKEVPDGTFYFSERTHIIEFRAFAFCMANDEIGVNGFFLYCYLRFRNDCFRGDYNATAERLSLETSFSERTVKRYLDALRTYNVVVTTHEQDFFVIGLYNSQERRASGHWANKYEWFSWDKVIYKKLKPITLEKYKEWKKDNDELTSLFG